MYYCLTSCIVFIQISTLCLERMNDKINIILKMGLTLDIQSVFQKILIT